VRPIDMMTPRLQGVCDVNDASIGREGFLAGIAGSDVVLIPCDADGSELSAAEDGAADD
jgi:hypothetical protein